MSQEKWRAQFDMPPKEMPDLTYERFFECQESIYRGDECLACGAVWDGHALDHKDGCKYLKYLEDNAEPIEGVATCDICGRSDDHEHDWSKEMPPWE